MLSNMEKLEEFWKHADSSIRDKLIVYDAVTRSKLMYGLESAHLTETLKEKIDMFQRKGLRQILKLPTTYGQMKAGKTRSNTNENILKLVNAKINTFEARELEREEGLPPTFIKKKGIIWLSEFYEKRKKEIHNGSHKHRPEQPN